MRTQVIRRMQIMRAAVGVSMALGSMLSAACNASDTQQPSGEAGNGRTVDWGTGGNDTAAAGGAAAGSGGSEPTGCYDGTVNTAQAPTIVVSGKVVGSAPVGAKVYVLWSVSSGSPDYMYRWGEATVDQGAFTISFDGPPPAEATNSCGVGVAIFALFPSTATVAQGKIDKATGDALGKTVLGMSQAHSLIWRDSSATVPGWSPASPTGYGCGACCTPSSGIFDQYVPVDCSQVTIHRMGAPSAPKICNWT